MDPTRTAGRPDTGGSAVSDRPRLARHVRLAYSATRRQHVLQLPETVVVLHGSGAAVLERCDGRHTVAEIVAELEARYDDVPADEVHRFLDRLVARRLVTMDRTEAARD